MKEYLQPLIIKLRSATNPQRAFRAEKYLKNQFKHLGIDGPSRKRILKEFIEKYGLPDVNQLEDMSLLLWQQEEREFQHCAVEIIDRMAKKFRSEDIVWIEKLIIQKSWWDTVDGISSWVCGKYFKLHPAKIPIITESWMNSGNMWLQRSILLFQLKYKKETNTELLAKSIIRLADHKEFFIRKAIGWALREYSKTDKIWVREFVTRNKLSPLSYREATKYC
jgi:3-methyladenine DNA glycosylase AlkD